MSHTRDDPATIRLVESLRWDGRLHRVDRHLRRLEASADHFGHPFDESEIRRRLDEAVADLSGDPVRKVRLGLAPDGELTVETTAVETPPEPVPVLLSDVRTDPDDELLYHKTNRRRTYERERRRAADAGSWEVLFLNTRGEVTEGSFTNVFVEAGASWYTPPVECGLLPGIFREVLLETREGAEERVLRPDDLLSADEVWLCNSVRGKVRARISPQRWR